jgi:hypothetical protein
MSRTILAIVIAGALAGCATDPLAKPQWAYTEAQAPTPAPVVVQAVAPVVVQPAAPPVRTAADVERDRQLQVATKSRLWDMLIVSANTECDNGRAGKNTMPENGIVICDLSSITTPETKDRLTHVVGAAMAANASVNIAARQQKWLDALSKEIKALDMPLGDQKLSPSLSVPYRLVFQWDLAKK